MRRAGHACLDSNILVHAANSDDAERHDRAKQIVKSASQSGCVLPIQVLAEFFHATTRKGLLSPERASDFVRGWLAAFRLAAHDDSTLFAAIGAVREHNLSFWDAMIWAVARKAGCSALITEDMQDKRVLDGVTFVNPFAAADAAERLASFGLEFDKPA